MILISDRYIDKPKATAIPGAIWKAGEGWVAPIATARDATIALSLFPSLAPQHPELDALRKSGIQSTRPFDNATPFNSPVQLSEGMLGRIAQKFGRTLEGEPGAYVPGSLHEYQSIDLGYAEAVLREHGSFYLGWDRGLGKTLGTAVLIDQMKAERVVVFCRNTAKRSIWLHELEWMLPEHNILVIPNDKKKREAMLAALNKKNNPDPYVLIAHYEAAPMITGYKEVPVKDEYGDPVLTATGKPKMKKILGKGGWRKLGELDLVAADEAHRMQNPKAQFVRAIKKADVKYKLALSGSIIQNRLEELYSVLNWLFPQNYHRQWADWNDRYLDYISTDYGKICIGAKPNKIEDMRTELGVFMAYRRKEDELDLPEKTIEEVLIELNPEQQRVYDDFAETMIAEYDDKKIKAVNPVSLLGGLRQIATGLELKGLGKDSSKLDRAVEMIEENPDEAFVVFSWYKPACYALQDRLKEAGIGSFVATGNETEVKRTELIDEFQTDPEAPRVFIGTIATLNESIQLTRATSVIFLDRSWNPEENAQAVDRVHRQGQKGRVTVTNLVAKNTVDTLRVAPIIGNKQDLRALVLGG